VTSRSGGENPGLFGKRDKLHAIIIIGDLTYVITHQ
jgi:hypothetical protein